MDEKVKEENGEEREEGEEGGKKEEEEKKEEEHHFLKSTWTYRLSLVYLRDRYSYCLFCGCQYEDQEDMTSCCPGINEEDHE